MKPRRDAPLTDQDEKTVWMALRGKADGTRAFRRLLLDREAWIQRALHAEAQQTYQMIEREGEEDDGRSGR